MWRERERGERTNTLTKTIEEKWRLSRFVPNRISVVYGFGDKHISHTDTLKQKQNKKKKGMKFYFSVEKTRT